jgi:hypothetical protein
MNMCTGMEWSRKRKLSENYYQRAINWWQFCEHKEDKSTYVNIIIVYNTTMT